MSSKRNGKYDHWRRNTMIVYIAFILLVGIIGMCASSCSPRIIEHVRTEVVYRDREVRDTSYVKDSVYLKEYVKGDTVYVDRFKYKYIYKDKFRTDTLLREVHDTTAVEVKVEKPLSVTQKAKIGAFWWLVGAVIALLLWTFRKLIF